jgi:hypothetical protein
MFKKEIDSELDKFLSLFVRENGGFAVIGKLALQLKNSGSALGSLIVSEHKQFESYQRSVFNRRTLSNDINYVLRDIKGSGIDTEQLKSCFESYELTYKKLVNEYLAPSINITQFISNLKTLISGYRSNDNKKISWNSRLETLLPKLIGHVFALWTLLSSDSYFDISQKVFLFQPHPAQVISIFRMLGLGYSKGFKRVNIDTAKKFFGYDTDTSLRNNLVQIGTGEGKSLTLAISAVVLSLLGFDVFCVCYSEYLSDRDKLTFKPLFQACNLTEHIFYGTFNKICEETINSDGDVRKIVKNLIIKGDQFETNQNTNTNLKHPRILLIDEVDVFFSEDFYGNSYNAMFSLTDPTIIDLIRFLWKERKRNFSELKNLISSSETLKKCLERFNQWSKLIDEAVKDMISSMYTFESHKYVVKDDKIGYMYQDEINFTISHGYNTLFAYLSENEKGNISNQSLNNNLGILIRIGSFSYAEIPLQNFNSIIGVTGTLDSLNKSQLEIIQGYEIKHTTYMPSVYGRNNLSFDESSFKNVLVESDENHFKIICQEINAKILGPQAVAVFVVFESIKELYKFFDSDEFLPLKNDAKNLTEEANSVERKSIVNGSTVMGRITLFTRVFGRGTDFIVHDESVVENGGVHVIQTFLSEEYSEEIQIKGRTARQGDPGTFQLIISIKSLEKYEIKPDDIKNQSVALRYQFVDKKRREFFETKYAENIKFVKTIKSKHVIFNKFLEKVFSKNKNLEEINDFLIQENLCRNVCGDSSFKTLILLDATESMAHLLDKTKKTIETVFDRITNVLVKSDLKEKSFQIKIAVFRNYNSSEDKILEQSKWETEPHNLVEFLQMVNAEGGWNNEAIEIGLYQANQEEDLSQIILIGDAPANSEEDIKKKRSQFSDIWDNSVLFKVPTYYENELKKLEEKKIKVNAFYVDKKAKKNFEEISSFTGGKCNPLDINSSEGSDNLINLINIQILENIGGNELVASYKLLYHL